MNPEQLANEIAKLIAHGLEDEEIANRLPGGEDLQIADLIGVARYLLTKPL